MPAPDVGHLLPRAAREALVEHGVRLYSEQRRRPPAGDAARTEFVREVREANPSLLFLSEDLIREAWDEALRRWRPSSGGT